MEIKEFEKALDKLQNFYGKEFNDTQIEEMYKYFQKYNKERFYLIISKIFQKNKYMPSLAELIEVDKEIPSNRIISSNQQKGNCKICNNNGFVLFYKLINGCKYQFLAYCECKAGENWRYDGRNVTDPRGKSNYYIPSYQSILKGLKE